jgi:hypothetical protein
VVVKVTDTCPCHYPGNYRSNKRWCCGDMPHFDLSVWAFEKVCGPTASTAYRLIYSYLQLALPSICMIQSRACSELCKEAWHWLHYHAYTDAGSQVK